MTDPYAADAVNAIAELTRLASQPFDHPKGGKGVLLPNGAVLHLEPLDPPLTHIRQAVTVLDAPSFVAYVNRFKGQGEKTTIFADYRAPKIRALIDYHDATTPDRLHHDVSFAPPWSEQWARWRGIDSKQMTQMDFAEFIEENMQDIVEPEGAAFLDLITGLHASKKIAFTGGVRLHDGSNQLTYAEDVEARGKGTIVFPSEFQIGAPIFFGGPAYKVRCLLRYRITDGHLVFIVKVNRRLFLEQTAVKDIATEIATGTGLTVLAGTV